MKEYDLFSSIGELDEKLLRRYGQEPTPTPQRRRWIRQLLTHGLLLLLVLGLIAGLMLWQRPANMDAPHVDSESRLVSVPISQSSLSFDAAMESLEKYYQSYSVGLEKEAQYGDEFLQLRCMVFAITSPLSASDVLSDYALMLGSALKDRGYLNAAWGPSVLIQYPEGYGEIWFVINPGREKLLSEYYCVFFSLEDGHIIDIRHNINKWGDYEQIPPRSIFSQK